MIDQAKVTWVPIDPDSKKVWPAISYYGLLVPYLYLPGTSLTWLDPQRTSPLERFLDRFLDEEKPERISTAQLHRATGVPRDFWALALRNLERAGRVVADEEAHQEADQIYLPVLSRETKDISATRRRVRVNRDLLVFPESDELVIAPEDGSDRLNAFIHAFAHAEGDWFRAALRPDVKRRGLKTYLADIAVTSRPIGGDERATDITFGVNGPRPAFVPVRAMAGLVDTTGNKVLPWFTHLQRPDQEGVRGYRSRSKLYEAPHLPMTDLPSFTAKIHDRLVQCRDDKILDAARISAPPERKEYQTLRLEPPFSWAIEAVEPACHSLDIAFPDIRFRILIATISSATSRELDAIQQRR